MAEYGGWAGPAVEIFAGCWVFRAGKWVDVNVERGLWLDGGDVFLLGEKE